MESLGKTVGALGGAKYCPLYDTVVLFVLSGVVIVDSHLFQVVSGYSGRTLHVL